MLSRQVVLASGLSLLAGIAVGVLARSALQPAVQKPAFVERREGGQRFTNPLLDCDIGPGVVGDEELRPFSQAIERSLASRPDLAGGARASVYFRELNDGLWFSVGEAEKFVPASLRKLPLMMALLKQSEQGPDRALLDREVTLALSQDYNATQGFRPSRPVVAGQRYTIRELMVRMIVSSDNNAFVALTQVVDPAALDAVYAKLSMLDPRASGPDDFLTVETYASFFRVLYNASYLDRGRSEWALELLARSEFTSGLNAGVPRGVAVAHKFGEKSESGGMVQLHDCGIVYYPGHPYLLCVMSRGRRLDQLAEVIGQVSRLTFDLVDAQHRAPE